MPKNEIIQMQEEPSRFQIELSRGCLGCGEYRYGVRDGTDESFPIHITEKRDNPCECDGETDNFVYRVSVVVQPDDAFLFWVEVDSDPNVGAEWLWGCCCSASGSGFHSAQDAWEAIVPHRSECGIYTVNPDNSWWALAVDVSPSQWAGFDKRLAKLPRGTRLAFMDVD